MAKEITDIITLNENGVSTLDYAEIVQVLLERYRRIYGYDIELDPRSADGRFIYDVATIINTGVDVIKGLYSNLNPNTAQGAFLDILASLTNVQRLSATASYAKIKITNNTDSDITYDIPSTTDDNGNTTYNYDDLNLIDDSGNEWYVDTTYKSFTIKANQSITLKYHNSITGRITTSNFSWETNNDFTNNCTIEIDSLSIGDDEESDDELRTRRASISNNGLTILGSLVGNLLDIDGVKDAYVQSYANNENETNYFYLNGKQYNFNQTKSVVILLRYDNINEPSNTEIGETIINYLTSGVSTYQIDNESIQTYQKLNKQSLPILYKVYWYKCSGTHPQITITLSKGNNYSGGETANRIASQLTEYLDNLSIGEQYSSANLLQVVQGADPKYQGATTYFATKVKVGDTTQENQGNYFNYEEVGYEVSSVDNVDVGGTITITISAKESA